jgi:hypothetical protein
LATQFPQSYGALNPFFYELIWTRVIPDILGRHALPGGRIAGLGATPDFHHGLLRAPAVNNVAAPQKM